MENASINPAQNSMKQESKMKYLKNGQILKGIKMVFGLGNPGKEYKNTFHNVGFLTVNFWTENQAFSKLKNFEYKKIKGIIFAKNLTFMNESGNAVSRALKFFKIKPEKLLVVHDDADIPLGSYKISFNRGSAGHKGIKSIIEILGAKNFYRLRIGVRHSKNKNKALDFILKKIKTQESKTLNQVFKSLIFDD